MFTTALRRMPGFLGSAGHIFSADATFKADRLFARDRNFLLRRFGIEFDLPDFSAARAFDIDEGELENIREVAVKFGNFGDKIIENVQKYVHVQDRT